MKWSTASSSRLQKTKLGYGLDKDTTMGPLHSPAQKKFVDELIAEAKASGAKVLEFGELPGGDMKGGNFVRPAIVIDPKPDAPRRDRRTVRTGHSDHSVRYRSRRPSRPPTTPGPASAGSVWTADPATANRVGGQLVCGYVWVNDHGANRLDLRAPFGGMKASGIGREQGIEGIRAFQDTRSISHLDEAAAAAGH